MNNNKFQGPGKVIDLEIELFRKIAVLDGHQCRIVCDRVMVECKDSMLPISYSPIKDDELNLTLRDKFEIEVNYNKKMCFIFNVNEYGDILGLKGSAEFKDKEGINKAVLLTIIEAYGNE